MNKQAHIIFLLCDLLGLWLLWFGYSEFQRIPLEISNQVDTIRFSNRIGFAVVGIGFYLLHLIFIVEKLWIDFVKKYIAAANISIVVLVSTLITGGIAGSYWIEAQVERAGYTYCRNASGLSALAKTLVYTKNMSICERLVEEERK